MSETSRPLPDVGFRPRRGGSRRPSYWPFIIPALLVVGGVIVFPWIFTLWMSTNGWQIGVEQHFVGLANYERLITDNRFIESFWRTILYTVLSVVAPLILGTIAALLFNTRLPARGILRGIFVMPMMATPVAIALVWTMMFHPQLGHPQLSALPGRHWAAGLGLPPGNRHPVACHGGNLAVDAAGHVDRPRRPGVAAERTL